MPPVTPLAPRDGPVLRAEPAVVPRSEPPVPDLPGAALSRPRAGRHSAARRAPGPVNQACPGCAASAHCHGGRQTCWRAGPCFRHRRPGPHPGAPSQPRQLRRGRSTTAAGSTAAAAGTTRGRRHRCARDQQHRTRTGPGRPRRHGRGQHRWGGPGSGPRREPCSGLVPCRRNGRRPGPARLPRSLLRSSLMAIMAPRLTAACRDRPAPGTPRGHPGAETSLTETLGPDNAVEAAPCWERPQLKMSGGVLLSHAVPRAVPSALKSLTSGFGMEPGVSPSPWPPKLYGDVRTVPAGRQPRPGTAPTAPREPHSGRETCTKNVEAKPLGLLVPVSSTRCHASTSGLSTQSSSWGPYRVNPEGDLILRRASRLDAFSGYPFRT